MKLVLMFCEPNDSIRSVLINIKLTWPSYIMKITVCSAKKRLVLVTLAWIDYLTILTIIWEVINKCQDILSHHNLFRRNLLIAANLMFSSSCEITKDLQIK